MFEGPKEEFYVIELRAALKEFHEVSKEVARLSEIKAVKAKLVKSLMSVLSLQSGEAAMRDIIERHQLANLLRPFLAFQEIATAGRATVVRRRGGERQAVDPATVLPKGTRIKMLTGQYEGLFGVVASAQLRPGKKGLDVTYFFNLDGPRGSRKRTSVKHGTLNKTWVLAP
ncbi:MAG: hypothetical protein FJ087_02215 [Deltaproteobacteria bacterium]|nr:hypothetical protein [Deltaproteobacteria bacterium]